MLPAIFVAHSSPMLAIEPFKGADYRRWAQDLPHPRAIVVVSAHWEADRLAFGETGEHRELIYDFGGFPAELYRLQYPAPGAAAVPGLIEAVAEALGVDPATAVTKRGLDHGVWIPFRHMWPDADVPILQLSMPHGLTDRQLFELGRRLSSLRAHGILIAASGVITHNLRELATDGAGPPPGWAIEFDHWVRQTLSDHDEEALIDWRTRAPHASRNHPTPEHFRPLLIAAGAGQGENVSFPIEGFEWGSLSRRSVQFG
ncbi:MAG: class III extradiol ring-cleavage dioxygenase [Pseudomonadota bacterium]